MAQNFCDEVNAKNRSRVSYAGPILLTLAALLVVGTLVWQAVTASGNPDPTTKGLSPAAMTLSTGILVFREGLEAILVLAAVTAGMTRGKQQEHLRAVPVGGAAAFVATIATWFAVVALISHVNAPELQIQAATGLLAIVVLLVVMNWFFHKIYWTGWIANHNNRRKQLMETANDSKARTFLGLALLGFTAIYREGFEIVLFLQNLRLQAGNEIILKGASIGLGLTLIVAALTFIGHKRLPYKKMLIATGMLLGAVLLVMVGESIQEMQQAQWIATTPVPLPVPAWMGLWFSVFPNVQSLAAQALAAALVVGSYVLVPLVRAAQMKRKTARESFPARPRYAPDETGHTEMPLSAMIAGDFGHVLSIRPASGFREQFLAQGFTPGTEVTVASVAPQTGLMMVQVRDQLLSLPRREANALTIRRCPPDFDLGAELDFDQDEA